MSDCEKYMELISQSLDEELSEPQKTELSAHMAVCPDCRRLYKAFALISSSVGEDAEPPEDLRERVMDAVRAGNGSEARAKKRGFGWGRLAALAACLAVVIFAASKADIGSLLKARSPAPKAVFTMAVDSAESGNTEDSENALMFTTEGAASPAEPTPEPDQSVGPAFKDQYAGAGKYSDEFNLTKQDAEALLGSGADIKVTSGSDSTVSLMDVSTVTLFSGNVTAIEDRADWEPVGILTDEESILLIMDMLEFTETADESVTVSGEPLFVVEVNCVNEADSYTLSVWVVEGRLYCLSSLDGKLYVAAGDISDLILFIANA